MFAGYKSMRRIITSIASILLAAASAGFAQTGKALYQTVHKFPIEDDGSWDYLCLDENTGYLFVSHGMATEVIDSKTGAMITTIQDTRGVHGIALAQKEEKAFISCGKDSTVSVVFLPSLELIVKVNIKGANPDAIVYDSFSGKVFVFNGYSANASVMDAKTNKVAGIIPLAGKPEFAVSDGKGRVYVNIQDASLVAVINSKTLKVEKTWPLSPGEGPTGLALDTATHRLFSVCANKKMVVMNSENGKVITTLDIGDHVDGCVFDPELKRVYSSNGEGTITVVQEENANEFWVMTTIKTQFGARTICLDKKTHHLYLSTAQYREVSADEPVGSRGYLPGTFMVLDIAPVE